MTPLGDNLFQRSTHKCAKNDLIELYKFIKKLFLLRQEQRYLIHDQEKIYVCLEKSGFRRTDINTLLYLLEVPAEKVMRSQEISEALEACLQQRVMPEIIPHAPRASPWLPKKHQKAFFCPSSFVPDN